MGAEFSHQNSIHVATEVPTYHPGDTVRGNIYLNVVNDIHCEGIHMKITGYEKTSWEVKKTKQVPVEGGQPGETRTETYFQPYGGKNEFFKVKIPIYHASQACMHPGQYAMPFSFVLPTGLPGIFEEKGNHGSTKYSAQIVYKLKAECHVSGLMKSDLKHKQHLILREQDLSEARPVHRDGSSNVTQYCCVNRGTAMMRVHTDKQMYCPGETAQVVCEVDNQSSIRLRAIKVKLFQKIELNDGLGHKHTHVSCVCDSVHDGVDPFTRCMEGQARFVPLTLASRSCGQIQPQACGRLVHCEYWLQCQLDVPMGGDIDIKLPISIFAQSPSQARWELAAPPGWNPNVMPAQSLNIAPSAPPLPPPGQQGAPYSAPATQAPPYNPNYSDQGAPQTAPPGGHQQGPPPYTQQAPPPAYNMQ